MNAYLCHYLMGQSKDNQRSSMPTLNWIGKDEVLNYNPPYHTLEKKYTFNAKNIKFHNICKFV